jgi:xanthine dehydrogenase accessory factor
MSHDEIYRRLRAAIEDGTPVAVATVVQGNMLGAKLLVQSEARIGSLGDAGLEDQVVAEAQELLAAERSETRTYQVAQGDSREVYIAVHPAPPTLLIFGAVHVAQSLSRLAKQLGYRVIVTDARATLATEERFPDVDQLIVAWPDAAIEQLEIGPQTYVAILTHDPKFDEPALIGTLATEARYIGAVGSRKTNQERRHRLQEAGVEPDSLDRVRGPIGLNIGAESPDEMAVSILAEIIAVRRGRPGGPLTDATGRIRGPSGGDA